MSSVVVNVLTCVVMVLVIFYIGYSEHVDDVNYWIVIMVISVLALLCTGASTSPAANYSGVNTCERPVSAAMAPPDSLRDFMSLSSASSVGGGGTSSVSSFSLSNLTM
jgi:hypothetical protein